MRVAHKHIRQLRPYLIGEEAKPNGEWDMYCPLHPDGKRSASLNILTGDWYCFAGCGGGNILELIAMRSRWVPPGAAASNGSPTRGKVGGSEPAEHVSAAMVAGWHKALLSNEAALEEFITERGLTTDTIIKYQIGWHADKGIYTIPVFGPEGELWNVRRYDLHPRDERRKIWSVKGMRATELYPIAQLESERLIIGEGELDVLMAIQNGYPAITRTGAADVWRGEWNVHFKDKLIYLAHDADVKGQTANRKVGRALHQIADVRVVELPYPIEKKHGKDLTDFFLEHDASAFEQLLAEAKPFKRSRREQDPDVITVLESFDSQRVGLPVKVQVTVKGRKEPGYTIPRKIRLTCTRDAGTKCNFCPLNPAGGEKELEISPTNPMVLGILDAPQNTISKLILSDYGVPGGQCQRLTLEVEEHQAVEILFGRPSIDHADGTKAADYKNIKITSVGRHDTLANNTVVATGALYPNPRDQRNEFLAWTIHRQETSIDRFQVTPESVKLMRAFQPRRSQRPLKKLGEINRDLANHVTKILGRPEMHAVMDLTFHSALSFRFGGQLVSRGWIESIIVGDTRTGKSEAAERLVRHFGAGEIVGGETATIAGLVGGLQQVGGKDWTVTWGSIPINDRRIVVIDELSGLLPDDISKMSDVRASGVARLTKIQQEVTLARTRLLWLGNPRRGGMDQFTYGVDALWPLIGNPEDIARFDLAMAVALGDVPSETINRPASPNGSLRYTSQACHTLLMWVWTRMPDQIVWAPDAEATVYRLANDMGERYVENPPLVQAANIRIKIARVAVALAGRTFSTDDTHERIVVRPEHVEDAVRFIDHLYEMPTFGYAERSRERLMDLADAQENRERIRVYLLERRGLAKFLRSNPSFRRQDIEEIMNVERDTANAIINKLWEARMVRKEGSDIRVEGILHQLLREVKW